MHNRMRVWRRTLLLLSGLAAVACAGDGPVAPEPVPPVMHPPPSLTGKWFGDLGRRGIGDWTEATVTLDHKGDLVTGTLVNARGREWDLRGPFVRGETSDSWEIAVQGLPGTSTCAGIILFVQNVERAPDGRETALSGRLGGRCFGTVAGAFRLARLAD